MAASRSRKPPPARASAWQHYGAPAAFLLAVTIAVLLVRGSFDERTRTPARRPAATTTAPARTTTAPGRARTSTTAPAGAQYHDVQAGDTFGTIAAQYGKTVAEIEALNPGVNSTSLHVGQRIRVG